MKKLCNKPVRNSAGVARPQTPASRNALHAYRQGQGKLFYNVKTNK